MKRVTIANPRPEDFAKYKALGYRVAEFRREGYLGRAVVMVLDDEPFEAPLDDAELRRGESYETKRRRL